MNSSPYHATLGLAPGGWQLIQHKSNDNLEGTQLDSGLATSPQHLPSWLSRCRIIHNVIRNEKKNKKIPRPGSGFARGDDERCGPLDNWHWRILRRRSKRSTFSGCLNPDKRIILDPKDLIFDVIRGKAKTYASLTLFYASPTLFFSMLISLSILTLFDHPSDYGWKLVVAGCFREKCCHQIGEKIGRCYFF